MRRRALLFSCLVVALALPANAAPYSYETWHTLTFPEPGEEEVSQVVTDVTAVGDDAALVANDDGDVYRVIGDQVLQLSDQLPGVKMLATIRGADGGDGIVWLAGGAGAGRSIDGGGTN